MPAFLRILILLIPLWFATAPVARAQDADLGGIWQVTGFTKSYGNLDFLVRIKRREGNNWTATKLNGSRHVPGGQQHFHGRVTGTTMQASIQIAFPGFAEPSWEQHQFNLERDAQGKVTRITLTSGKYHPLDDIGDASITDAWSYVPWPQGRLLLTAPQITRNGYAAEQSLARSNLQNADDDTNRWQTSQNRNIPRLTAARSEEARLMGEVARLNTLYESAWVAVTDANSTAPPPEPDRSALPSRLRVLYSSRTRSLAEITRAETIILAHSDGSAPQSTGTISALFTSIDRSRAFVTRMDNTIARVRAELNIPDDPDPNADRDTRILDAKLAFKSAGDAYNGARRLLAAAKTETAVAIGQVDLAQGNLDDAAQRATTARARLKFLNQTGSLQKIEGYALGGETPRLIFEAIPKGLDAELRALGDVLKEVDKYLDQSAATAAGFKAEFISAFDRGTVGRNQMVDLIYANAAEMAVTAALVKTGEIALAFGTGGPVGLAVELAASIPIQFLLYEDGVVFENFDETGMHQQYRAALSNATRDQPDPADACRNLNIQISKSIEAQLASKTSTQMQRFLSAARGGRTGNINADIPDGSSTGNTSQRIQPNLLNYFAIGGTGFVNEFLVEGTERVIIGGIDRATQQFEQRIAQRSGQAILDQVAKLDARILNSATDASTRTMALAARKAALEQLSAQTPALADDIARNIAQHAADVAKYERFMRLAAITNSPEELRTLTIAAASVMERLGTGQTALRGALGGSIPAINMETALQSQRSLWVSLGRELDKLDRFKSTFARAGLRGTTRAAKIKAGAVNIAFSMVMAAALDQNIARLQQQEIDLWKKIFQAEIEQSTMFVAWQRARCINWALLDQRDFLRRNYGTLYNAYDPAAQMQVLRSEPFQNHEGLRLRLVFDPPQQISMRARVATLSCPRNTQSGCRIPAGGLGDATGPYLPVTIDLGPPR